MKKLTRHYRRMRYIFLRVSAIVIFINIIMIPTWVKYEKDDANLFRVLLNGEEMGYMSDAGAASSLLAEARRKLAGDDMDILYADADLSFESSSVIFARIDEDADITERMTDNLKRHIYSVADTDNDYVHAYTLSVGGYIANMSSADEICEVLQAALDRYQERQEYVARLVQDPTRELNVLTTAVLAADENEDTDEVEPVMYAGFEQFLADALEEEDDVSQDKDFADYDYGLMGMSFGDNIEVVDSYVARTQLTSVSQAIEDIVDVREVNTVYEVVEGDTLSGIAIKTNIPMDRIIELNETLENENSLIRPGDELIVTTVEPPLTVEHKVREYIEEYYDAEIEYVYNDDWYTTDRETLRQPSAGRRNIVAETSYSNDKEVVRDILKEELVMEAVAKKVEVGTKIPPTYIKPISGGRVTSGFGYRTRPNAKGATSNHQGVDWGTPIGTTVMASCGGTVTKAGWGGGYGYCVFIKHPDGRETRYAHLSKVLVSVGQTVSQGQKIALSGNTGASTGPHVHFEIRIGGVAVNPLKYLN